MKVRLQEEEDLETAADEAYGVAVSVHVITRITSHLLSFFVILSRWVGSRSRCTEDPARGIMTLPPGVITILSQLT